MHEYAKQAFDSGCFVLLPVDACENRIMRWRIKVTDLAAVNTELAQGKIKDFDSREVSFMNNNRPAARFLYYHVVVTLLRNRRDRQSGWEKFSTEQPAGKPFATMGRYMREPLLLALAKNAGDLNAEEKARLLGGEGGGDIRGGGEAYGCGGD